MEEKKYILSKVNYRLMILSLVAIVAGFLLMTGKPSGEVFNPDIFSTRRIVIGPMVSFAGFVSMIAAILYKPKKGANE